MQRYQPPKVRDETYDARRGGNRRDRRNEDVLAWPNGFHESAETAISCRGPGPASTEKEVCQYQYSREEEEGDAQMCSRGEAVASGTHIHSRYWENVKCTRRKVIRFVEEEMRAIENVTWRRLVLY